MAEAIQSFVAVLLSLCCASQESGGGSSPTVPGPEATDLAARARGWIAITLPVGGIRTVRLPELTSETPRAPDAGLLPVHSLAGPDARGRIAFVENDMLKERHALALLGADGAIATVFEGQGDALWDHAVGRWLALDPQGARAALVARAGGMQLRNPDAYLMEGELEVWDVGERKRIASASPIAALDEGLCWFPDGKRLAYTALIDAQEAEALLRAHVGAEEAFGRTTLPWKRAPAVHVLEVDTGSTRALHAGLRPIVSPDGRRMVLCDFEG